LPASAAEAIPAAMADKRPYYLTTAISYPNDAPHIGHAYEAVATDALARFRRLQGRDVFFLTGTDEHGIKMLQTAKAQGITPSELADRNTPKFRDMVRVLNCSNNDFIRTREERHARACQELWRRMQDAGDIYLDKYAGWYSVRDEAYYDASELKEGPDGRKLSPTSNNNYGDYDNPEVNEMIDRAYGARDAKERNALWGRIDHQVMEDAAWAPLVYDREAFFWSARVRNWTFTPWLSNPDITNLWLDPNTP